MAEYVDIVAALPGSFSFASWLKMRWGEKEKFREITKLIIDKLKKDIEDA